MRISDWSSDVGSSDLFFIDWKPRLSFTDDTLFYASYARGYKGGGANPPGIGADPDQLQFVAQSATFRPRSEEHTSELQSLMRISYAVFCLKKKHQQHNKHHTSQPTYTNQ